jgi:hypothetical protein
MEPGFRPLRPNVGVKLQAVSTRQAESQCAAGAALDGHATAMSLTNLALAGFNG